MIRRVAWVLGLPIRTVLLGAIRLYRAAIGPMLGPRCRFHPSCSAYAEEAVRTHGAVRGTVLAAWRILRCNPFSAGGPEPVPPRRARRKQFSSYDCVPHERPA